MPVLGTHTYHYTLRVSTGVSLKLRTKTVLITVPRGPANFLVPVRYRCAKEPLIHPSDRSEDITVSGVGVWLRTV